MKKERKEVKTMLELKQTGKNWFNIVDDGGCMVSGTKEELNGLYQQLIRVRNGLPQTQTQENTHIILLQNNCNGESVQLRISDSALRFLDFLLEEYWMGDENSYTKLNSVDYEFI